MKERSQEKRPQIISDLNTNLGTGEITVESLAEKLGINDATLYRWVRNDAEFVEALEIIKEVQKDDPFKTGGPEDGMVNNEFIMSLALNSIQCCQSK